ncbi:MAG: response regulator transcription factor [Saprospiraceae bacterium]
MKTTPFFQQWLIDEVNSIEGFVCQASFSESALAIHDIPQLNPDLVLVDLGLGDSNLGGVRCMLHIKLLLPEMKFMVITSHSDDELVFEALKSGANAYMLKSDVPFRLPDALAEIMEGGAPMSPEIALKVIRSFHQPPESSGTPTIDTREAQILGLIAKGFLNKENQGTIRYQ